MLFCDKKEQETDRKHGSTARGDAEGVVVARVVVEARRAGKALRLRVVQEQVHNGVKERLVDGGIGAPGSSPIRLRDRGWVAAQHLRTHVLIDILAQRGINLAQLLRVSPLVAAGRGVGTEAQGALLG